MNINQLIKKVKENLGMTKYLKTTYDDLAIYNIIKDHALRDWANFFKFEFEPPYIILNRKDILGEKLLGLPQDIIRLIERSGLSLEDIKKVQFRNGYTKGLNNSLGLYSVYNSAMNLDTLYAGHSLNDFIGDGDIYTGVRFSCWFEKPNRLRFNFPISDILVNTLGADGVSDSLDLLRQASMSFYTTLSPNLLGISHTREHDFFQLCRLHVMRVIYENETKYMENIQSGNGTINLKIEEWAQSGAALTELLAKLENYNTISNTDSMVM